MKLTLNDKEKTLDIERLNETLTCGKKSLMISVPSNSYTLDEVSEILKDNTQSLSLDKGTEQLTFDGYTIINTVTREISDYTDTIIITLSQEEYNS